ncbi:MAG: hypothetical protein B7Y16_01660 [Methylotenera sp. 24-45-7]|jgi:rare lipoprotein A|nr:MAG: hypothetical protein B7Y72_07015 [Mehylophilales bacterium 35-46-6]OYZ41596.1 MAG: hypothetical protein B7Y16_01660 [Methylotenera sp. 24-45-7]OZA08062.1 MAG: hypothetical protein B7X97_07560 [Methylotenera sp. 17-45-7]OZA54633.1 MAG: hypothetical protein B7X73_00135 [Methylophilales bacterium 39-45-7]HQS36668.1 septal ring lytic transglycosylase RlpA family protein [Methylotenera sp.]
MFSFQRFVIILCITLITACGGSAAVKKTPGTQAASPGNKGAFYLDDGPGDNPPSNLDSIPDAELKSETPLNYPNKPYSALGNKYTPMTQYAPYTQQGLASWYGKRYHGKKTSSGEVYDMYAMTGAHTTLPIPSYVKVTNLSNKRSVIVRINDRGPFKRDRLIDLSYAAAHKLRLIEQGSGMVEVEWIDTSPEALKKMQSTSVVAASKPAETKALAVETATNTQTAEPVVNAAKATVQNDTENNSTYYVQVGAFKNETNGDLLQKKVISLDLAGNAAVTKVYNNGVYRVKLGPFPTRKEADISANKVRKQLNTSAIVTNQ